MSPNKLKVLILCRYIANQGAVVVDSVNSFIEHSVHDVFVYSSAYTPFDCDFPFDDFDVIVIHYSIIPTLRGFISNRVTASITNARGNKVIMAQDEYRSTIALVEYANRVQASLFYSVVPCESWGALYKDLNKRCKLVSYLTGYVPTILCTYPVPTMKSRKWDIVYRGRIYPRWFGSIMLKKIDMALNLKKSSLFSKLKLNISVREKDRLYGADWVNFLSNSRTVFATESDVEIVDPNGKMLFYDAAINQLLDKNEDALKDELKRNVATEFTTPFPGSLAVISPRIFEAIALRTVLLMPPGYYSGVLEKWVHYIPLEPDFSNAESVLRALNDNELLIKIAARAYADVCCTEKYSYKGFAESFDSEVTGLQFADRPAKIEGDTEPAFFAKLQKIYPFYYMQNAHGLKSSGSVIKKALSHLKTTLFFRKLTQFIKNA